MKFEIKQKPKIILAFIFILSITPTLQAKEARQETEIEYVPSEPSFILPSPTSQAYQRFMGFEPELSTGAVNVTIPLYTINFDDFSLPLTLNYQSNGIKREAPHFPLGYGWLLHPGLRITRTIFGKEDRSAYLKKTFPGYDSDPHHIANLETHGREEDSMHDVFTLSLPQGQAVFVLEGKSVWSTAWQAVTVSVPYQITPRIDLYHGGLFGFKVIDEKGIIYYFGDEDTSHGNIYRELSAKGDTSTFLLRKVILPGGQEASFEWNVSSGRDVRFSSCYVDVDNANYEYYGDAGLDFVTFPLTFDVGVHQYITDGTLLEGSNLSRISMPDCTVDFYYSGEGLQSIYIKDACNHTVKNMDFEVKDRLLHSLVIGDDEKYHFRYNPIAFDKSSIHAQDFWGYYNGANNSVDYPSVTYMAKNSPTWQSYQPRKISGADRKPDSLAMKAYMLEQIDYPTGGYTRYEYEPHRYIWDREEHFGGGLRVKQMISGTNGKEKDRKIIKTYKYGRLENGLGHCSVEPNEATFMNEEFFFLNSSPFYITLRKVVVHPESLMSGYFLFNLPVWYDEVTEWDSDNGAIRYCYDYEPDGLNNEYIVDIGSYMNGKASYTRHMPLNAPMEYLHVFDKLPRLGEKFVYDSKGKEIMQEKYTYTPHTAYPDILPAINYRKVFTDVSDGQKFYPHVIYDYVRSYIAVRRYFLFSKETISDGVKTSVYYKYNKKGMCSMINTCHSDSTEICEDYLFANDTLNAPSAEIQYNRQLLQINNRFDLPMRIQKSVNGEVVARKMITYQNGGEGNGTGNDYLAPHVEYFQIGSNPTEARGEFRKCNKHGKPVEVSVDGKSVVYLWGYCNQYPIAKIENALYQEIVSILGETFLEEVASAFVPDEEQLNAINELRLHLSNALINTYTYQPLVGLLSETAPTGLSVGYTYDSSGRLVEKYRTVTDDAGKQVKELIESYTYTYKKL